MPPTPGLVPKLGLVGLPSGAQEALIITPQHALTLGMCSQQRVTAAPLSSLGRETPGLASWVGGESDSRTGARATPPAFVPLPSFSPSGQTSKEVGGLAPAHLHSLAAEFLGQGLECEACPIERSCSGWFWGVWWFICP